MSGSMNLRLHPWRDSVEHCLRLLESPASPTSVVSARPIVSSIRNSQMTHEWRQPGPEHQSYQQRQRPTTITSVDVSFHETDYKIGESNKMNLVDLFEAIAQLPQLESVIVQLAPTTSSFPLSSHLNGIPPVAALTALLASSTELGYLTLIGLPLFADDFDMNGCVEMLRIHPSLHSIVFKDCRFSSQRHFDQLKSAMVHRKSVEYLNNQVVDISTLPKEEPKPWYTSIFGACLFGCILMMLLLLLSWLVLTARNCSNLTALMQSVESVTLRFGFKKPPLVVVPKKVAWWKRILQRHKP